MKHVLRDRDTLIVTIVGLLLTVVSFLVVAEDAGNNADANIGAGLLFLFGIVTLISGLVIFAFGSTRRVVRVISTVVLIALIALTVIGAVISENEANRTYCERLWLEGRTPVEGPQFCEGYI